MFTIYSCFTTLLAFFTFNAPNRTSIRLQTISAPAKIPAFGQLHLSTYQTVTQPIQTLSFITVEVVTPVIAPVFVPANPIVMFKFEFDLPQLVNGASTSFVQPSPSDVLSFAAYSTDIQVYISTFVYKQPGFLERLCMYLHSLWEHCVPTARDAPTTAPRNNIHKPATLLCHVPRAGCRALGVGRSSTTSSVPFNIARNCETRWRGTAWSVSLSSSRAYHPIPGEQTVPEAA